MYHLEKVLHLPIADHQASMGGFAYGYHRMSYQNSHLDAFYIGYQFTDTPTRPECRDSNSIKFLMFHVDSKTELPVKTDSVAVREYRPTVQEPEYGPFYSINVPITLFKFGEKYQIAVYSQNLRCRQLIALSKPFIPNSTPANEIERAGRRRERLLKEGLKQIKNLADATKKIVDTPYYHYAVHPFLDSALDRSSTQPAPFDYEKHKLYMRKGKAPIDPEWKFDTLELPSKYDISNYPSSSGLSLDEKRQILRDQQLRRTVSPHGPIHEGLKAQVQRLIRHGDYDEVDLIMLANPDKASQISLWASHAASQPSSSQSLSVNPIVSRSDDAEKPLISLEDNQGRFIMPPEDIFGGFRSSEAGRGSSSAISAPGRQNEPDLIDLGESDLIQL